MSRIIFTYLLTIIYYSVFSQPPSSWEFIGLPESELYQTSLGGGLMHTSQTLDCAVVSGPLLYYDGNEYQFSDYLIAYGETGWDPLLTIDDQAFGTVHEMTDYLDGIAFSVRKTAEIPKDGSLVFEVYYHNGIDIELLGTFNLDGTSHTLNSIDDQLYITGVIGTGKEYFPQILKLQGLDWVQAFSANPVFYNDENISPTFGELINYQNTWILGGGSFFVESESVCNLLAFDGLGWFPIEDDNGNHFRGVCGEIRTYQNIIVIEQTTSSPGEYNPQMGLSNGLIFWNGSNWSAPSPLYGINNALWGVDIVNMEVIDTRLYVSGSFYQAGNETIFKNAVWDGSQWCGLQTNPPQWAQVGTSFGLYEGRMVSFGIPDLWLNEGEFGLFIHDGETFSPCSEPVSVSEQEPIGLARIYPNPTNNFITLETDRFFTQDAEIICYDASGRLLFRQTWPFGERQHRLNLSHLTAGLYFVTVETENGVESHRIIKSE